jgi:hypothetical protein
MDNFKGTKVPSLDILSYFVYLSYISLWSVQFSSKPFISCLFPRFFFLRGTDSMSWYHGMYNWIRWVYIRSDDWNPFFSCLDNVEGFGKKNMMLFEHKSWYMLFQVHLLISVIFFSFAFFPSNQTDPKSWYLLVWLKKCTICQRN